MKFFLDTANIDEIREVATLGILEGITTNPTLMAREKGITYPERLKEITEVVDGPISAEVVALDVKGMIKEGKVLAKISDNINVKVPMSREGLKAIHAFALEGIPTNTTLIFNANQALLAAKAGTSFVSPFVGRLDDITNYGMDVISDIVQIFDNFGIETEIITASIRNPIHVMEAAMAGSDIVTLPSKVLDQIINHPLTDIGIQKFREDWDKVKK